MNSNFGFVKVAAIVPDVHVADCNYNAAQIQEYISQADAHHAAVVCFPELSLTAYTCQDLFLQQTLLRAAEQKLQEIIEFSSGHQVIAIVGVPVPCATGVMNCAAVVHQGSLLALVPQQHPLPDRQRWFTRVSPHFQSTVHFAGRQVRVGTDLLFATPDFTFGVEVGTDFNSPCPPSTSLCLLGADIVFNPCAYVAMTDARAGLHRQVSAHSARLHAAYVLCGSGSGESTQDALYAAEAVVYEDGKLLNALAPFSPTPGIVMTEIDVERLEARRHSDASFTSEDCFTSAVNESVINITECHRYRPGTDRLTRPLSASPFNPDDGLSDARCSEAFNIQVHALAHRIQHVHARTVVLGISGGLDSTLALMVCAAACDLLGLPRTAVVGITMPGFGTSDRTHDNALALMNGLGITQRRISIREACLQHFQDIGHDASRHDVTFENAQARERTQILMDVSNQMGGFVIGTGDLSELALGWATYNGDHMCMYGVNASVPKTFIRHLVTWIANQEKWHDLHDVLLDIVNTPVSPELIPADEKGQITQKTEDLVGPYELHDFFIYHFLRNNFAPEKILYLASQAFDGTYDETTIRHWLTVFCQRFFRQQFKRSCSPDGPKVTACSLSPRGEWAMPSDAFGTHWTEGL